MEDKRAESIQVIRAGAIEDNRSTLTEVVSMVVTVLGKRSGDLSLGHPCLKQQLNSLRFFHFQPKYHGLTPAEGFK
jgi:hypothetical protein